jgi:hypothetical protein
MVSEKRYDFPERPKLASPLFAATHCETICLLILPDSHRQVSMFLLGQPKQFHIIVNQNKTGYENDLIQL